MKQLRIVILAALVVTSVVTSFGCGADDDGVSTYGAGDTGGESSGGQDDDLSPEECQSLKSSVTSCYDSYCGGAGAATAFCACWNQGMDLAFSCQCTTLDLQAVCTYFDNAKLDPSSFNCSAAQQAVGAICMAP